MIDILTGAPSILLAEGKVVPTQEKEKCDQQAHFAHPLLTSSLPELVRQPLGLKAGHGKGTGVRTFRLD
jgi:hypothetical protein